MEASVILALPMTNDSGWGIRALVDISKSEMYREDYRDVASLYRLKMRELKIVDNQK